LSATLARLGRQISLALTVSVALCATPALAGTQPAARTYRLGILEGVAATSNGENLASFRRALSELGYVEGHNLVLEYRSADGRAERFADLARELVRLGVDVIVTRGTPAALAARHVTTTIPIVMASSGEPVFEGLVRSLARPGGNLTGFHLMVPPEVGARRLQLLKEAVSGVSRVGILWNPVGIQSPLVRAIEQAGRLQGVQLRSLEVSSPDGFDAVFEAALISQVDAFIAVEDQLVFGDRVRIVSFAAMGRLPAIYGLREFVDAGGLMSYGPDRRDLFRRSAGYVDRILKGARPGDLPIEPPTRLELAINLKTARALGLTIPPALLQRADYVIP
jgi:putative ABC transport system substrate-binding protein